MKELIILRHGKSDWGSESLKDIDRPLAERGYNDAYFLSEWFAKNHPAPELIISSTATRALNTALIFARAIEFNMANFQLEKGIYDSSMAKVKDIIKKQDNKYKSIMIVGHNPTFTDISNDLSDELYFDNVPTCGIIAMKFDIKSWEDLSSKSGKINFYQFPKNFKN